MYEINNPKLTNEPNNGIKEVDLEKLLGINQPKEKKLVYIISGVSTYGRYYRNGAYVVYQPGQGEWHNFKHQAEARLFDYNGNRREGEEVLAYEPVEGVVIFDDKGA